MYWIPEQSFRDQTVAVLGSGPSMSQGVADSVKHLPRIAINTTYKLARDADIIYGADAMWWRQWEEDVKDLPGLKVSIEYRAGIHPNGPEFVRVLRWGGTSGYDDRPGYVRWGGHGGYQALHLAASMGAKRVLLFGFDCHGGHWHGTHPSPLGNPLEQTLKSWMGYLEDLAPILEARGVEVFNCSPISRLECFLKFDSLMASA